MDSWQWAYRKLMLLVILCFVLSLLPPWPAGVSVSKLTALSPITGHAAPVTIKCCLTSTRPLNSSIPISAPYHCWCCAAQCTTCCYYFSSVHNSSERATGLAISYRHGIGSTIWDLIFQCLIGLNKRWIDAVPLFNINETLHDICKIEVVGKSNPKSN